MSALEKAADHFASHFAASEADRSDEPAWLASVRGSALERFARLGLPTRRDEAWKYTSLSSLAEANFNAPPPHANGATRQDVIDRFGAEAAAHGLVFENGRFAAELSAPQGPPDGVVVTNLATATETPAVRAWLETESGPDDRAFEALNAALARDGACVGLDANASAASPVQLLFLSTPAVDGASIHTRNRIAVGRGARAAVSFHFASLCEGAHFANHVTRVELAEAAELDLVTIQDEDERASQLVTVDVEQGRDSRFRSHWVSLGGGLTRNELNARLSAPGADCSLNGLFLADGTQHIDNQTAIDHASPHGTSRELYKGVLDGHSRGVFHGLVHVRPGAQKTSAQQSNPNLLVSDDARINSKPTLEIHADDVKCSHGSTVGRLDDDALFYLRARGVGEREAREMLTRAFASEVADAIPVALRARVEALVAAKLARSGRLGATR